MRVVCCMGVGGCLGSFNGRPDIKYVNITIYNILLYTIFNKTNHLGHSTTIRRPYIGQIEGINEMFIGIFSKLSGDKNEHYVDYYDAIRIVKVAKNETDKGCVFWFDTGAGVEVYETPTYDCGGLIELIMQARLRPAEFMPSLYVGKKPKPDDNGNSVAWSAKDNA